MKKNKEKNMNFSPSIIQKHYIEIFGDEETVLTGKTEILKLEDSVLKIKCNEHRICFIGEQLRIVNYTYAGIQIKGLIKKIEFERGE